MAIEAARKPVTKHGDPGAGGGVDVEPFRFEARRARLDWRLLHAVDVDRMMRENDLDALESTLAGEKGKGGRRAQGSGARVSGFEVLEVWGLGMVLRV
jgi:hypothetical protein